MRKVLVAGVLGAMSAAAGAQTGVTVYGASDAYLGYARSGSDFRQWRLNEGGHVASQLGFRGTEDLGGGLKAIFNYEMGISLDTGAGNILPERSPAGTPVTGVMFTRQSYVGLTSERLGNITLGRQYTPIFRTVWRVDPLGVNSIFSPVVLWAQTDAQTGLAPWQARADNAIMYVSPSMAGFVGTAMWAAGESTVNSTVGRHIGLSLSYANGPWWLGWGYQQRKSDTLAAGTTTPTTSLANVLAASYEVQQFRVGASVGRQRADLPGFNTAVIINIHGQYNITPTSAAIISWGRRDVNNSPRDQDAITLGYNYDLSKRTMLYARLLMLRNKGNSNVSLGGVPVVANAGDSLSLTGLGILHRF